MGELMAGSFTVRSFGFYLRVGVILCLVAFPLALNAITIDKFEGTQNLSAIGNGTQEASILQLSSALGGNRELVILSTSPQGALNVVINQGVLSHDQGIFSTGQSTLVWDGDNNFSVLDYDGLGGIDFTEDGGTAVKLTVLYDNGTGPLDIIIDVVDASDPFGRVWSTYTESLAMKFSFPITLEIPFSDFVAAGTIGGADFSNVGAVRLRIIGRNEAEDAAITFLGTNGECEDLVPQNGSDVIVDECGVCGGDNSTCLDCLGVPNGAALPGTKCNTGKPGICEMGTFNEDCGCDQDKDPQKETCNGVDDDCDGKIDERSDGQGSVCATPVPSPEATPVPEGCVEQKSTKAERRRARKVKKTAKVLNDRTHRFVGVAKECGGDFEQLIKRSEKYYNLVKKILNQKITNIVVVCPGISCIQADTIKTKKRLKKATKKLYRAAKDAKVNAIKQCNIVDYTPHGNKKVTEDYRNDVLKAINKLPKSKLTCES
jgi:hypothetical protein